MRPVGALRTTKAGSLIPAAVAHRATVKPHRAQPVLVIRMLDSLTKLFLLVAGVSILTVVWSMFPMLKSVYSLRRTR